MELPPTLHASLWKSDKAGGLPAGARSWRSGLLRRKRHLAQITSGWHPGAGTPGLAPRAGTSGWHPGQADALSTDTCPSRVGEGIPCEYGRRRRRQRRWGRPGFRRAAARALRRPRARWRERPRRTLAKPRARWRDIPPSRRRTRCEGRRGRPAAPPEERRPRGPGGQGRPEHRSIDSRRSIAAGCGVWRKPRSGARECAG